MTVLLEGNIAHLSLFNLLQLIKLEQKTCLMTISIKELQQTARLYFKFGAIKHAELNRLYGPDAIYRLLCWWTSGQFEIKEIDDSEIPSESIQGPLESMLIESAKRTDDLADLRQVVPSLDSKVSFSQEAIIDIQNGIDLESPDWIPGFVTEMPITFSLAKYFDLCPYDDMGASNSLKYMLSAAILTPHVHENEGVSNSAIDSLASIVMEYLGFNQSQQLIREACESLQINPETKLGFNQMLSFSDYIIDRLGEFLDDTVAQEIEWRLRARVTSLS